MTQEQPERRQQILEAALHVFSDKGFHKATNKDIAEAAGGISPGLIYWYFKDKQDLFLSLIRERAPLVAMLDDPSFLNDMPPREALTLIGTRLLDIYGVPAHAALFRVILSEMTRFPQIAELFFNAGPRRLFDALDAYFQAQIARGTMRPHDTAATARSFVGTVLVHIIAREVLRDPAAPAFDRERVVTAAVELSLYGLVSVNHRPDSHT